jgi:hypothetical protein
MRSQFYLGALIVGLLSPPQSLAQEEPTHSAPVSAIASGKPFWVDSSSEPDSWINARVDIGTLRQERDEIEVRLSWPFSPGARRDYRFTHPELQIPEGSRSVDMERVVCKAAGPLSFMVEHTIVSPAGAVIFRQNRAVPEERRKAEESVARLPATGYGGDPRSLVCWAAARKCEGQAFKWPPPPNNSPLEHSERREKMMSEYNRAFVPGCSLSQRGKP